MGIIRNVPIVIGPYTYPIDFVVIDMPIDSHCPIIFGRTFLNTAGANIDCRKETISLKFGKEVMIFHFSKFVHKPIIEDFEEELEEECRGDGPRYTKGQGIAKCWVGCAS